METKQSTWFYSVPTREDLCTLAEVWTHWTFGHGYCCKHCVLCIFFIIANVWKTSVENIILIETDVTYLRCMMCMKMKMFLTSNTIFVVNDCASVLFLHSGGKLRSRRYYLVARNGSFFTITAWKHQQSLVFAAQQEVRLNKLPMNNQFSLISIGQESDSTLAHKTDSKGSSTFHKSTFVIECFPE